MEYKPTITYSFSESGDENLFLTLSTHLRKVLQSQTVKWKRSYGRNPHELTLDVKFLPLTTALLKRNDLVTRPYFHVFWTDCNDLDFYRSSVKAEIASWLSELFGNDIYDWLIVIVSGDGTSKANKPKLALPRTSLADKIKTDFCSKSPDRLHILQDPMKDSTKTTDSWSSLAMKLADFTMLCLENAVTKYEDRVRAERERRNDKSWNFCSYFIMQEELAFMFEMLSLHEEALIQYNELDAMFAQYLLNAHAGDIAHWLTSFTCPITCWRSLTLWRRIDGEARQMMIEDKATLIDVRNYLFARHYHLLFAMGDMKRITDLMHNFLHSTILELDILEIELPIGAKECWVFMSCMELTQTLDRTRISLRKSSVNGQDDNTDNIMKMSNDELQLEIANLWNLARCKLLKLGELCGLMPDTKTSSEDLQTVVALISGMGEEEERDGIVKPPSLILREALSSKENFRKQYLELSELAMGTFKYTDRYRSARDIGNDLAEFYMRSSEPHKAESLLLDCVRMYTNEAWPLLVANSSEKLANCYKLLCNVRRYLRLCCALMCNRYVMEEKRIFYCDELRSHSTDFGDIHLPILLAVFANVTSVQFIPAQTSLRYRSKQHIVLHVHSRAPKTMNFHSLQVSLRRQETNDDETIDNSFQSDIIEEQEELDAVSYATFSSDEENGFDSESLSISVDKATNSVASSAKKQPTQKNHVRRKRRRYISTSSYDSIFAVTQKTQLGSDGKILLVPMEEPFSEPSKCMTNRLPPSIHITYESEEKEGEISWAGITCRSSRNLLKRQDSYQSLCSIHSSTTNIVMETYYDNLQLEGVSIHPGDNEITVEVDTSKPGQYTLRQLRFSINKLHFVLPRILPVISYNVTREKPTLVLDHAPRLFCNVEQTVCVIISTGDYGIDNSADDQLIIIDLPKQLRICKLESLSVETEDGVKTDHSVSGSKIDGSKFSIQLPETVPVHSKLHLNLCCVCAQPIALHDLGYKHHRRTHSAPPTTIHKRSHVPIQHSITDDAVSLETPNRKLLNGDALNFLRTPLSQKGRNNESPVKKFLSFVREVADRVESKNNKSNTDKSETNSLAPLITVEDDFLEVTLEDLSNVPLDDEHDGSSSKDDKRSHNSDSVSMKSEGSTSKSMSVNSLSSIKKSSSLSDKHSSSRSSIEMPRRYGNTLAAHDEFSMDDDKVVCNMHGLCGGGSRDLGHMNHPVMRRSPPSTNMYRNQETISIELPWSDLPSLSTSITFVKMLEFNHHQHRLHLSNKLPNFSNATQQIISIIVANTSPCSFYLQNFCLVFLNPAKVSVTSFEKEDKKKINSSQSITLAWKVDFAAIKPSQHSVQFNVDVVSDSDTSSVTPVTYKFEIENIQTIYTISTEFGHDNSPVVSGQMVNLTIIVQRLRADPEHEHARSGQQLLMYQVVDTRGRWAVCGKSTGVLSLPIIQPVDEECVATATLEIMPLIDGTLHRPNVMLQRYLKRRSSEFDEQLSSTESPVLKPPRLMDFKQGEVLDLDEFKQIKVIAFEDVMPSNPDVENEEESIVVKNTKL